jgi:hypothetical protein
MSIFIRTARPFHRLQTRRLCELSDPVILGVTVYGGNAEVMIAEARGIASIPDELSSVDAAPLRYYGGCPEALCNSYPTDTNE